MPLGRSSLSAVRLVAVAVIAAISAAADSSSAVAHVLCSISIAELLFHGCTASRPAPHAALAPTSRPRRRGCGLRLRPQTARPPQVPRTPWPQAAPQIRPIPPRRQSSCACAPGPHSTQHAIGTRSCPGTQGGQAGERLPCRGGWHTWVPSGEALDALVEADPEAEGGRLDAQLHLGVRHQGRDLPRAGARRRALDHRDACADRHNDRQLQPLVVLPQRKPCTTPPRCAVLCMLRAEMLTVSAAVLIAGPRGPTVRITSAPGRLCA